MSDAAPWEDYASPTAAAPPASAVSDDDGPWANFGASSDSGSGKDAAAPSTTTPFQDAWGQVKHQGAQILKAGANAAAAIPLMAMDAGVAARNLVAGKNDNGQYPYELPSTTYHAQMNDIFGAPQTTAEKINDVALPVIMGGASGAEQAPALLRAVAGVPEVAAQAPANFANAAALKNQLMAQTIKKAQDLGLVVPPQTTNPSAVNATVETIGGKIATQQAASVRNQPIANAVAARELGLNPDVPLTEGSIRSVISQAGNGYQALRDVGTINTDDSFLNAVSDVAAKAAGPAKSFPGSKPSPLIDETDSLLQPSFDSSDAVDKIAELRDSSSMAYRSGDTRLGAGYRQLSNALEDQIDRSISANPDVDSSLVGAFRSSRVLAAKAHSVLDALNPSTGDVSIQGLARSGDPLSGDLKTLADFGNAAPRATQDVAKIGSHGVSHLDTLGTMLTGVIGEHAAGPYGIAAAAAYPLARTGARAYALGPGQAAALPKVATGTAGSPVAAAAAVQAINANTDDEDATHRASGGKVDHDALTERLFKRWSNARKATNETTKPLLSQPDSAIIRALGIAQEHI